MVLSDNDIKNALKEKILTIKSPRELLFQPSSIDLHLSKNIMTFARRRAKDFVIDTKKPVDSYVELEVMDMNRGTVIHPREFFLGVTTEWFSLSNKILANVEGKSSLGRLGLVIHATAGFIDPGFAGHITLEITNLTELPIVLYPDMPIAQIRFSMLSSPSVHIYGDKKLGSKDYKNIYSRNPKPIASQYWKNLARP